MIVTHLPGQGAWLWAGWPRFNPGCRGLRGGDGVGRGGDFSSLHVQIGSGIQSASYKMNTGGFPWGKGGRV